MGQDTRGVVVEWAMRYASPSILSGFEKLKERGCGRILVVPLYPQYAGATTASVADKVEESLAKMRWRPELRSVAPYYNDPVYIEALADSVLDFMTSPDVLKAAHDEFEQATKTTPYFSLVPDGAKPDTDLDKDIMAQYRPAMSKFYLHKTPRYQP